MEKTDCKIVCGAPTTLSVKGLMMMMMMMMMIGDEMLAKRFDAHNRPENCPELVVPSVNKEIWRQLPPAARKLDLKLAQIQRAVVKSAIAISRVANELLDSTSAQGERVKHCKDSFAMLGHASREMSLHRRTAIRPYVNKSLSRICEEGVPFTDKLFGHDLPATLKDIKEMDKLGTSFSPIGKRWGTWHSQYDSGKRSAFFGGRRAAGINRDRTSEGCLPKDDPSEVARARDSSLV